MKLSMQRILRTAVAVLTLLAGTTVTAQDRIETEFSYGYKLLANVTPQTPDVGAALIAVGGAVLLSLNQVIQRSEGDIEIQFLASKETGPCEQALEDEDFDICTKAETQVNVLIPADLDPDLVKRVALLDIQTFIIEFNADSTDIQILFEFPLAVSAVLKVSLLGVDGTMGTIEKEELEATFLQIFDAILQTTNPNFSIDILQVLTQEAENVRRRLLRSLQETTNPPVNNIDLYIRASCEGTDCTNTKFEAVTLEEFAAITQALELALRAAGREADTDYFESLTAVQISDSGLNDLLPANMVGDYQQSENEKVPSWVWIVMAVDFILFAGAVLYVLWRLNVRKNAEMNKYDEYGRPLNEDGGFIDTKSIASFESEGNEGDEGEERE